MARFAWEDIRLDPGEGDAVWELFHENSKISRFESPASDEEVLAMMATLWESLPYAGYPRIELPRELTSLDQSLGDAIAGRVTTRRMQPISLDLRDVATMLYYAYGLTRSNIGTDFPRPFRTVPSGGALYPLELFFHTANVNGLDPGLYHYHAGEHHLRLVRPDDASPLVAEALVQRELAVDASLLFFIAALFERSTFKYGNRGYRFALLEAGHVAQNVNLVAGALGLGCVNIGGYFDRHVDELLGLNGVTQSAVYVVAVGRDADREDGGTVG